MSFARRDVMRGVWIVAVGAALAMLAPAVPAAAQTAAPAAQSTPSAAGLWQKLEDGKPDG